MLTTASRFHIHRNSALVVLCLCSPWAVVGKEYALVIDAGSSGSRLGIYTGVQGAISELMLTDTDKDLLNTKPGLSSYIDDPASAGISLQGIIEAGALHVPQELQSSTKLWVKATAGMRTLNQTKTDAIFGSVDAYLTSAACPFHFEGSQIISGDEEALFTYITVNYLRGTIGGAPEDTIGVLEMGGASMQIAFRPEVSILANEFPYYVDGVLQSVYAISYMFGVDAALHRYQLALARDALPGALNISSPCSLSGDEDVVEINGRKIHFYGTGDNVQCESTVSRLLHTDYECNLPPCPIMGRHVTPINRDKRFVGVANFFFAVYGLGLIGFDEEKVITPAEVRAAAISFCTMSVASAQETSPGAWKYGRILCFQAHLVLLMLEAFGFEASSTQVWYSRAFNWKLGSMLYDLRYMPALRNQGEDRKPSLSSAFLAPRP
jgi:Golgi nucleoside diphosphatase